MSDAVEPEIGGAALPPKKPSSEYVETLPVLEAPKELPDYVTYVKGSNLRKARAQLERLKNARFAWAELLLAVASLCLGAYLGVLPTDIQGVRLSFFYKTILPVVGVGAGVAYLFLRRMDIVSSRDVATDVLDRLPLLSEDLGGGEDQNVQVSVERDDGTLNGSDNLAGQQGNQSTPFEATLSNNSYIHVGAQYGVALNGGREDEAAAIDKQQCLLVEKLGAPYTWRWAAERSFWQTFAGKGGGFDELIELAAKSDNDPDVCATLAAAYRARQEHLAASHWFRTAARQAETPIEKIYHMGDAVIEMLRAGARSAALDIYREFIALNAVAHSEKMAVAKRAALIFERLKVPNIEVALQEVVLELDPADDDLRFSVAYNHSERERNTLSAYHYDLIPASRRSGEAWNNLGVAWSRLDLEAAAFDAYSRAHELGQTLGTSNIANKLIQVGMHSRARELLNEVVKLEHDVAVDRSMVRLNDEIEESKKKAERLLQSAPEVVRFFRNLGRAALSEQVEINQKSFADDVYEMTISIANGTASGKARKRSMINALALKIDLSGDNNSAPKTRVEEFNIRGETYGTAIDALLVGLPSASASLLTSEKQIVQMLMILDKSGEELLCLESVGKDWTQRILREQPAREKSS
ncbi:tetratricopeptide (TPR) repeat protein [Herbaspirillum seropedicae]|uniref:tetratricopeptide repeat protein n=1 Tax=Herbaspirillum seropedicae TaxID=964 RepID=UPI0033977781